MSECVRVIIRSLVSIFFFVIFQGSQTPPLLFVLFLICLSFFCASSVSYIFCSVLSLCVKRNERASFIPSILFVRVWVCGCVRVAVCRKDLPTSRVHFLGFLLRLLFPSRVIYSTVPSLQYICSSTHSNTLDRAPTTLRRPRHPHTLTHSHYPSHKATASGSHMHSFTATLTHTHSHSLKHHPFILQPLKCIY